MKNLNQFCTNNLGTFLMGMLCLLMGSAAGVGCGNDRGIPVLVTIRTPAENLSKAEVSATLNGVRFSVIAPNHPTNQFVIYLPADANGQLDLSVTGKDQDDCASEGRTQISVQPVKNGALEAIIDIDARVYPQCKLTVKVQGNGTVTDTDGLVRCSGSGGTPCTTLIRKQTKVAMRAKEGGIDSDFEEWQGACSCTSDACELQLDGPKEVLATFRPRRCRPDGSCEALQRTELAPPTGLLFSANARWAVKDELHLMLRKAGAWEPVGVLPSPAYALWGNQDSVWIITKGRQVVICQAQGCKPFPLGSSEPGTAAEPATLFSVGGSGNAFWAVDKRSVHRCDTRSCKTEPLPPVRIDDATTKPKILTGFLKNNSVILVGGNSKTCGSLSASCHYFFQNCSECKAMVIPIDAPCQLGSQIPFRFENGEDSAMWAQLSERLLRISGSQYPIVGKPKDGDCEFFPEAVEVGLHGQPNQFQLLLGAEAKISRRPVIGGCQKLPNVQPGLTLRAAWISSTGDAWVVGDKGTAFFCSVNATSQTGCTRKSTGTTEDLVQIQQDGTSLWAFSRDGKAFPLK